MREFADCGDNLDIVAIFGPPEFTHIELLFSSFVQICTISFYISTNNCFASEGVIGVLLLKM
jgi:hypothetical protein